MFNFSRSWERPSFCREFSRLLSILILALCLLPARLATASGPATTVINDVVYRADGSPAHGTLLISWPAFVTAEKNAVSAGSMSLAIGAGGSVNLALIPNQGATPAGTYYKVVLKLDDGTTSTEAWVVGTTSPTTISAVRATVLPATTSGSFATVTYVDTQNSLQDVVTATKLSRSGDTPVRLASVRYASQFANIQAAITDAGATGAVEIPPSYSGADRYTNPNNIQILDLRGMPDRNTGTFNAFTGCGLAGYPTDDTAAFLACTPHWLGKTVLFPKTKPFNTGPDYLISITLPSNGFAAGTKFMGEGASGGGNGAGTTIQRPHNLPAFDLHNCRNCSVENFEIIGDLPWNETQGDTAILPAVDCTGNSIGNGLATGDSTDDAVIVGSSYVKLRNLYIEGAGRSAIRVDGSSADFNTYEDLVLSKSRGVSFCMGGGSDDNAWVMKNVTSYEGALGGFWISSALGGTMIEAHSEFDTNDATAEGATLTNSSLVRAANVVTVTTTTAHNLVKGHAVVERLNDAGFNGTFFVATTPTSTTFTYAQTAANATSALNGTSNRGTLTEALAALGGNAAHPFKVNTNGKLTVIDRYCESGGKEQFMGNTLLQGGDSTCDIDYVAALPQVFDVVSENIEWRGHSSLDGSQHNQSFTPGRQDDSRYPAIWSAHDYRDAGNPRNLSMTMDLLDDTGELTIYSQSVPCYGEKTGEYGGVRSESVYADITCPERVDMGTGEPTKIFPYGIQFRDRSGYKFRAAGANAAGVIHDDGAGHMTSSAATGADFAGQSANFVFAGPSSGAAAAPNFRALIGADLPTPSATTLGGIESLASVAHKWINTISTAGVPSSTQPACGDLSDSAASCSTDATNAANITSGTLPAARLPNPSATTLGGVESLASVASKWINAISTSGVLSATRPTCADLSDSGAGCSGAAGGVTSFNSRTGAVSPASADYTAAQVTNAFDVTVADTLTNVAAPASPASGKNSVFSDSTDLRLHDKNASGVIGTTVVADTGASNNFLTAISAAGAISKARPTCGSLSDSAASCATDATNAANITSGTLPAARLPNPSATTLGGIESLASVASKWINTISTSGVPSATQPAFSDISGSVAASQLPNPSATTLGGVESLASVASKWINTISTSGVPSATQPAVADLSDTKTGSGNLVLATSPTITTPTISGALGGDLDSGTHAHLFEIANDTTTGTTVKLLAKISSAKAIKAGTGDAKSYNLLGIVVAGAGTSGNAQVAVTGVATCTFDNAATAGNWAVASTGTAGDCHDAGSTLPTDGTLEIGMVYATIGGAGDTTVLVFSPQALITNTVAAATNTKITVNAMGQVTATAAATLASADFANQGTTTTVLHGNASGNPSFGAIATGDLGSAIVRTSVFAATGSGTCTSSSTLFLFPAGNISALTCTVTSETAGIPMPASGTIKNLNVVLGTGGKAGDAVTVRKGAVDQTVTCAYGTGTTCSDVTHTFTVTGGDKITVKNVTGVSETAANIYVTFELWN